MASLIELKYGTSYLSLNVDGVFRVEESGNNAVCYYNTPGSVGGEVWVVTIDMSSNVTADDASALELMIKRSQQAPASKMIFELPSDRDAYVDSMTVSDEIYP